MPSNEERRQAAREKLERQNERRAADARKRKVVGVTVGAVVVVALVAAGCWLWLPQGPKAPLRFGAEKRFNQQHVSCDFADRGDQVAAARKSLDASKAQVAQYRAQLKDMPAEQRAAMEEQLKLAEQQNAQMEKSIPEIAKIADRNKTVNKPSGVDVPNFGTFDGTIKTNQGEIGFSLDRSLAPCNVETFHTLINAKYFNDTICHRETAMTSKGTDGKEQGGLFVLQCGDPTGTGLAGPNWTSPDEAPTGLKPAPTMPTSVQQTPSVIYPAGTIAVAKSSNPNSGSSQFFLVYKDTWLPADYAVIGKTTDAGLKTLQAISAKGIAAADFTTPGKPGDPVTNGKPKEEVRITSMALS